MFGDDFVYRLLTAFPVILFSLTVHEFFHGYVALRFGDPTARDMGRLTFNPIAHIDMFGLIVMIMSQFSFGWAKPVPVNLYNLRNPKKDHLWIAFAGPLSNFGMAIIFGIIFRIVYAAGLNLPREMYDVLINFVVINIVLGLFNMIPLYPLDGSHILNSLASPKLEEKLITLQRFSPLILIGLIITNSLSFILGPFIRFFVYVFAGIGHL